MSVVVTCHNLEKYIGAAIESVLLQNYAGPVEVLVVDDASTDSSPSVIQAYDRVRYVRTHQNLGVLMATVLGIRESSGDLLFFLDGDDLWHPDKLRLSVARFDAEPALGLLTHDLEYIDGDGRLLARTSRSGEVMATATASDDHLIRDGILLHSDYVWLGSAFSVRKSAIDALGFCEWAARLPDPFNTYQDWPLAFWAASRPGVSMGYVPDRLFRYRVHGSNHSGDARSAELALRNVGRARNTVLAMQGIAVESALEDSVQQATARKLEYYEYLMDLYSERRVAALHGFVASLGYWARRREDAPKEVLRFMGVQLLGATRFFALANRVKRSLV